MGCELSYIFLSSSIFLSSVLFSVLVGCGVGVSTVGVVFDCLMGVCGFECCPEGVVLGCVCVHVSTCTCFLCVCPHFSYPSGQHWCVQFVRVSSNHPSQFLLSPPIINPVRNFIHWLYSLNTFEHLLVFFSDSLHLSLSLKLVETRQTEEYNKHSSY